MSEVDNVTKILTAEQVLNQVFNDPDNSINVQFSDDGIDELTLSLGFLHADATQTSDGTETNVIFTDDDGDSVMEQDSSGTELLDVRGQKTVTINVVAGASGTDFKLYKREHKEDSESAVKTVSVPGGGTADLVTDYDLANIGWLRVTENGVDTETQTVRVLGKVSGSLEDDLGDSTVSGDQVTDGTTAATVIQALKGALVRLQDIETDIGDSTATADAVADSTAAATAIQALKGALEKWENYFDGTGVGQVNEADLGDSSATADAVTDSTAAATAIQALKGQLSNWEDYFDGTSSGRVAATEYATYVGEETITVTDTEVAIEPSVNGVPAGDVFFDLNIENVGSEDVDIIRSGATQGRTVTQGTEKEERLVNDDTAHALLSNATGTDVKLTYKAISQE